MALLSQLETSFWMNRSVALPTKCDEILFGVMAELASRRNVVNFKVGK